MSFSLCLLPFIVNWRLHTHTHTSPSCVKKQTASIECITSVPYHREKCLYRAIHSFWTERERDFYTFGWGITSILAATTHWWKAEAERQTDRKTVYGRQRMWLIKCQKTTMLFVTIFRWVTLLPHLYLYTTCLYTTMYEKRHRLGDTKTLHMAGDFTLIIYMHEAITLHRRSFEHQDCNFSFTYPHVQYKRSGENCSHACSIGLFVVCVWFLLPCIRITSSSFETTCTKCLK